MNGPLWWKVSPIGTVKRAVCDCGWKSKYQVVPLDTFPPEVEREVRAHESVCAATSAAPEEQEA